MELIKAFQSAGLEQNQYDNESFFYVTQLISLHAAKGKILPSIMHLNNALRYANLIFQESNFYHPTARISAFLRIYCGLKKNSSRAENLNRIEKGWDRKMKGNKKRKDFTIYNAFK